MSVIIMHPKHNLEMKYENGEGGGSYPLPLAAAARLNAKYPDHDAMKNAFLWRNCPLCSISQ